MALPFLNRKFAFTVLGCVAAAIAVYPLSPAGREEREMATMRLFFDQLEAEWAAAGRSQDAPLRGGVSTLVNLMIRVDRLVDDATWADLLGRVRAKRDAYEHVSPIHVTAEGTRFENFARK